ncbi:hypothetical protein DPMN_121375 [Dreissena polymorpha]|uniref:Uncharacterized protein n=1 Tax=Dreissena polymorpha TaxID=45954 RepID=A0A9D4JPD6_DREPO|nr:hypothetical protein DPMN_121375 [Dreissena polymorpha]
MTTTPTSLMPDPDSLQRHCNRSIVAIRSEANIPESRNDTQSPLDIDDSSHSGSKYSNTSCTDSETTSTDSDTSSTDSQTSTNESAE